MEFKNVPKPEWQISRNSTAVVFNLNVGYIVMQFRFPNTNESINETATDTDHATLLTVIGQRNLQPELNQFLFVGWLIPKKYFPTCR